MRQGGRIPREGPTLSKQNGSEDEVRVSVRGDQEEG